MEGQSAPLPMQILLAFLGALRPPGSGRQHSVLGSAPPILKIHGLAAEIFCLARLDLLSSLRWILGLKCWASTQWWHGGFRTL
ncbi:hypothetical protein BDW74DRAFT_143155 [Aspergillus multicolor]|uniref:uncharacterized protein n=1 Tax=Aspergillus multicolor TaxID=41759 RepID=UPI003CCCAFB6